MDAASPKFSPSLSRDGSSLRNRLDLEASSALSAPETASPNLLVKDRVEIGRDPLPYRKPRATVGGPLTGFFERARARLQEFVDASKQAKAAKKARDQQQKAEQLAEKNAEKLAEKNDEQIPDRSAKPKESPHVAEEPEKKESSLQDIFKKREAQSAYKEAVNRFGAVRGAHAADQPSAGS